MQFKERGLKFFGMKGRLFLAQPLLEVSEPPLKFLMGVFFDTSAGAFYDPHSRIDEPSRQG
jgi:hypothetical protein